ncbi:MAG TPA: XrtA system polysaccharide deacetylase [Vicinamibacterales bacterium]|jgi:polysaccharide deacetylase family protein (PEP-CTERM system associated)|nr:XrtA system polysaccharide deacetylase [Vicinamibacterales bacterium]
MRGPANIFSVDVEDYFHVEAFSDIVLRDRWSSYPLRVEANTRRVLDLLDEHHVEATFFVLGWVADRLPQLVREIAARGHEVGCHSYWHRLIYTLTPREFAEDTARAKSAIEQAAGQAVHGYRAPSYSITRRSLWALEVLAEAGFTYDSSIFPVRHDTYGIPDAPRAPFRITTTSGPIVEYPIATFRLPVGPNFPVGGGGYLRLLPFWYTRIGVARAAAERLPLVAYIHPWEIDPQQPRLPGRARSRFRHYTNLSRTRGKLSALLRLGSFTSFAKSGLAADAPTTHFGVLGGIDEDSSGRNWAGGAVLERRRREI